MLNEEVIKIKCALKGKARGPAVTMVSRQSLSKGIRSGREVRSETRS